MTETNNARKNEQEPCRYCGGNCPNDEDHACDGYLGDIDSIYATGTELFEFLYAKCREDHDLLAMIVDEYLVSLSDNKLIELEDFLTNNFGDD